MSPRPADSIETVSIEALPRREPGAAGREPDPQGRDRPAQRPALSASLKAAPAVGYGEGDRPIRLQEPHGPAQDTGRRKARGAKRDSDRVTREVIVKAEV